MAIPVIYQLITMVILMIIGVVLHKKNFLSLTNAKGLSIVLTRVAVPCNMVVLLQIAVKYILYCIDQGLSGDLRCDVSDVLHRCAAVLYCRQGDENAAEGAGAIQRRRRLQQRYFYGAAVDYGNVRRRGTDFLRSCHVYLQRILVYRLLCAVCNGQ